MKDLVRFYWMLLLRRAPVMIALVILFTVVGVVYAINQPSRFEASARLLVESPQIPDDLAESTVNTSTSETLTVISERLMRRATLIDIANKLEVFANAESEMAPDAVVRAMRAATKVNQSVRRNQASFVDISFTAGDPEVAAAVVNEYITRILEANQQMRAERAGNTLDFFEQRVEQLSSELALQSGRIAEFKAKNSDSLPEALNFRLNREATLKERLLSLQRELAGLEDQRNRVITVYNETGQLRTPDADLTPEQRQLRELESELASALAIYSESNPRVTVLRTRIEQLRKVVDGQSLDGEGINPAASVYEITLAEIDSRAELIKDQIDSATEELEVLRSQIERTPQTTIALESLDRDYRNIQAQYDNAVARLSRARTGEQIELAAQGERISVVENATPPERPSSPNRRLIAAAGGLAGVGAAAGLFALLEILNTSIRRPSELVSRVGITPLATISYIETRGQRRWRRFSQAAILVFFFVIAPATLYYIDQYVLSLGEILVRVKDMMR